MEPRIKIALTLVILVLPAVSGWPGIGSWQAEAKEVNCDVHKGPCTADLAGKRVSLDISPKPVKAMRDLTFILSLAGEKPTTDPYIDLSMPGMNMGRNRVILRSKSGPEFQGTGTIVR